VEICCGRKAISITYYECVFVELGTQHEMRMRSITYSTVGCLVLPYWDADKSLARPTSRCILLDGENISFDASLVIYINSNNIPPIMIINRIYETQYLLSL
jgi:hypothetical protein